MELEIRNKHAIVLLVKQILDQLDEIASLKRQGYKAAISQQLLKEMCTILPDLTPEQNIYYNEVLIKFSISAGTANKCNYTKEYADNSVFSKRSLMQQLRTVLKVVANA